MTRSVFAAPGRTCVLICIVGFLPGSSGASINRDTKAMSIILRMESMYAHLKTYSDSGQLTGDRKITFKTLYKAPGRFYFAFTSKGNTAYIVATGRKVPGYVGTKPAKKWLAVGSRNGRITEEPIHLEIARFTGVSLGTSFNVPAMLFPRMDFVRFDQFTDARLLRTESFSRANCFVIYSKEKMITLWIDVKTFELKKLVDKSTGNDVTVYKARLNPALSNPAFNNKPLTMAPGKP